MFIIPKWNRLRDTRLRTEAENTRTRTLDLKTIVPILFKTTSCVIAAAVVVLCLVNNLLNPFSDGLDVFKNLVKVHLS